MMCHLPHPLGPMIAVKRLNGPIVCFPLYDLKFSNSSRWRYPIFTVRFNWRTHDKLQHSLFQVTSYSTAFSSAHLDGKYVNCDN